MTRVLLNSHIWIIGSVVFIVYSQCVIRWRLSYVSELPLGLIAKLPILFQFLISPWVLSAIIATFFSGLFWIIALTKFELSYAYPWMASVFLLMLLCGVVFFGETLSSLKVAGTVLVFIGLIMITRG